MDDQILLVEYHSKMNAVDPLIIEMLENAVKLSESGDWKGIVIGNDGINFCAGANLGLVLFAINLSAWKDVEDFLLLSSESCGSGIFALLVGRSVAIAWRVMMHEVIGKQTDLFPFF